VGLHLAAQAPHVVLDLSPRRVERFPQGHVHILVGVTLPMLAVHHDLLARRERGTLWKVTWTGTCMRCSLRFVRGLSSS
jgi:hypothetical protein